MSRFGNTKKRRDQEFRCFEVEAQPVTLAGRAREYTAGAYLPGDEAHSAAPEDVGFLK